VFAWKHRRIWLAAVYQPALKLEYFSPVHRDSFSLFSTSLLLVQLKRKSWWDYETGLKMLTFKDCVFQCSLKAEQASIIKSLVQKLLFSCLQQLNKIYFETSACKSDCPKGMERAGLIIALVQFLDKRFTLSHFVFFFLSFFLGLDIK
jgi:hypothetical protein